MSKVLTLGCTGGIGSGKSYVSRIFAQLGYPVYFSDDRAKLLYDTDSRLLGQMVGLLGEDILKDGKLDRGIVASRIFGSKELLAKVESFVHPAVLEDFERWKGEICGKGNAPEFVIFESAILLETPLVKGCADKVMTALLSGDAQIGFMGSEASIYVYAEGSTDYAVNFAQLTQRAGNFLVAREELPDFKWEDLKGKQVLGGRKGGVLI